MIAIQQISTVEELKAAIQELELRREQEGKELKAQFREVYRSIKPINLIKSTLSKAAHMPEVRDSLVNTSVGLTAGFLAKLAVQAIFRSPINKLVGSAVMIGVKNLVEKNPETVKSAAGAFFNFLKRKKDSGDKEIE